jgi:hypothetical protein
VPLAALAARQRLGGRRLRAATLGNSSSGLDDSSGHTLACASCLLFLLLVLSFPALLAWLEFFFGFSLYFAMILLEFVDYAWGEICENNLLGLGRNES